MQDNQSLVELKEKLERTAGHLRDLIESRKLSNIPEAFGGIVAAALFTNVIPALIQLTGELELLKMRTQ